MWFWELFIPLILFFFIVIYLLFLLFGCSVFIWWLMIVLGGLEMFSLSKWKTPWFTADEIDDDGGVWTYWGAENKSARTQAMRSNQRVRCTDVRWAMGKTIAENLFYTFNFPQFFLQDLFSVIEKEFCKCIIYLTCLLIWPWGRLMIWSSQRRARKPSPEINDLKNCQSISTCASHGESH